MRTETPEQNAHALNKLVFIVKDYMSRRSKASKSDHAQFHIDLWRFYEKHGNELLAAFTRVNTMKFIFSADATRRVAPEMIGKKSALYSGCALCIIPSRLQLATGRFHGDDLFCNFIIKNRRLISSGRIIPFPQIDGAPNYSNYPKTWLAIEQLLAIERKLNEERVASYAARSEAVPIFGEHAGLVQQLAEDSSSIQYAPVGIEQIALPTLSGISMDTLLDVMDYNDDPTARFRALLRSALKDPNSLRNERDLYFKILEIGDGVRELDSKFRSITQSQSLSGSGVFVGAIVASLSLVLPQAITEPMAKALGVSSLADGLRELRDTKAKRAELAESSFVLPWILHRQGDA